MNYDRTNALFKEGLKSKIDVVNAQVYLTDAEVSLIDAQGKYDAAIINLNNAMYLTEKDSDDADFYMYNSEKASTSKEHKHQKTLSIFLMYRKKAAQKSTSKQRF